MFELFEIVIWHRDLLIRANVYALIDNVVYVLGHACAVSALEEDGSGVVVRTNWAIVWRMREEVSL